MKSKYVARQAIFDRDLRVVAYELLFRDGPENSFVCDSISRATSSVIADSFLMIGLDVLTDGLPAYINFSRDALVEDVPLLLPPRCTVVEILESVEPTEEVVRACKRLAARRYTIALDDFTWSEAWHPILELADVVKIDFLATPPEERVRAVARLRRYGVRMLAEKVETQADFLHAQRAGYALFQGFFFSRPTMTVTRDLRGIEASHLRILEAISSPSCDLRTIEELVRRDLALTYRILRRASSPIFGRVARVASLRFALALLGLAEVRKWVSLLVVAGLSKEAPKELVRSALVRARFCEGVALAFGLEARATDLFLVGLLSQIDALLGRSMAEVVDQLALDPEIARTLQGESTPLAAPLRCAAAWERGDWAEIARIAETLPARGDGLPEAYVGSIEWLREVDELSE